MGSATSSIHPVVVPLLLLCPLLFDSSTDCQVLREGMGQSTGATASSALDVVITNALIIDAVLGVVKADIGIRGDTIVGIGKAGNPDVMDGVSEGMVVGATTEAIAGEKLILTAGTIDTHVHWICPQVRRPLASLGKSPPAPPTYLIRKVSASYGLHGSARRLQRRRSRRV